MLAMFFVSSISARWFRGRFVSGHRFSDAANHAWYNTFLLVGSVRFVEERMKIATFCLALSLSILPTPTVFAQAASAAGPTLPYRPSLDVNAMDRSIDPCTDFYQYSCGGWRKANPIPADKASWEVYSQVEEHNLSFLRGMLEQAASAQSRDEVTQKIGDFYGSCMDEQAINARGIKALQPELDAIAAVTDKKQLAALIARLQLEIGPLGFAVGSNQDPDNSEQQIASLFQSGLGLPDRDYYLKDDAKSKETREHYLSHLEKEFVLLGDSPAVAKQNAAAVMRIETALAKVSLTRVERRDPYKRKNKITLAALQQLSPEFDWMTLFTKLEAPKFEIVNAAPPAFFTEFSDTLRRESLPDLKNYLRFHVTRHFSPYLSEPFVSENFDFYRKYLRGVEQIEPRWKRCVEYTDDALGEALGQVYVRAVFPLEVKQSTLRMVELIEAAMERRINELDWMSPQTKKLALEKLHGLRNKIGYPDKWRDYSSVTITAQDFAANVRNANRFESHRNINKIGQPVDHGEWGMTPPTVNAYYNPQMNDVNFPAGVLQPPLYDAKLDDAPNYGDTGGTIGHELTHGFDDEGSKFDAKGNLANWWTEDDRKKFDERTKCIDDQYSEYISVDDIHLNGKLTLGENVADLGGEILAYLAWKEATKGLHLEPRDGLTPDQRFFVGFAQWACANERPEQLRVWAITDPHSNAKFRINGVVVNMPEFAGAFSCKAGQPMVQPKEKICKVW
jgi:putative endopeptidase